MTDIVGARTLIQIEEVQYRAAVSESTLQKVGALSNFISTNQHSEKQWFLNGPYNRVNTPQTSMDGLTFFQFDATIIDVWAFVEFNTGSVGTTEFDLLRTTTSGGAFTSIFSTTPKIEFNAPDFTYIHVGSSVPNTTAPVLSVTDVNAGDALRFDLLNAPTGGPTIGSGIIVHYRPR